MRKDVKITLAISLLSQLAHEHFEHDDNMINMKMHIHFEHTGRRFAREQRCVHCPRPESIRGHGLAGGISERYSNFGTAQKINDITFEK